MKSILPDQGNKVPQVRVGLGDIQALLSMLTGYLAYLRKAVLPSPRRETQLRTLEGLQRRLVALLTASRQDEDTPIWLTQQEIRALDEALSGFVQVVRMMIPASSTRDKTLREIEGFRDMLRVMLAPALSA
jgi:hypothetical protein